MAAASELSTGNGRKGIYPSTLLTLAGPLVLLMGAALAVTSLFVPWWHFQTCDPVDNCQPYVPASMLITNDISVFTLVLPILAVFAAGFFSLLLHSIPGLQTRP